MRGKVRYKHPGDLVIISSPYRLVTHDGHVKDSSQSGSHAVKGHVKLQDDWAPIEIPYETRAILIDEKIPLVMIDERIVMVPRSCIQRLKDE